jgi:hypothetical protein
MCASDNTNAHTSHRRTGSVAVGSRLANRRPRRSAQNPTATWGEVAVTPPAVRRTASRQGVVWWRVADEHSFTQSSTRRSVPIIEATSATILPCAVAHRHPQPNDGMASTIPRSPATSVVGRREHHRMTGAIKGRARDALCPSVCDLGCDNEHCSSEVAGRCQRRWRRKIPRETPLVQLGRSFPSVCARRGSPDPRPNSPLGGKFRPAEPGSGDP